MTKQSTANLGFETKLWAAADKLRGHMDPSEYKHVALGLIFLKYISDSFEETYYNWRNPSTRSGPGKKYEDIKGFCKAAKVEEVEKNGFVLTPGRYVGTDFEMEDDEEFEAKMLRLTSELSQQFKESKELETKIKENLKKVGFEI
ncbi:MAG: type I restriction-modification system subunit M N-terminal domain-containing protein [Candidatus Blackburnbacteria bacterium]|nr:type I restriction-modification system subunit M N-terminal domain-containing protein [Candidatus Blackburnbacteria bacterium]